MGRQQFASRSPTVHPFMIFIDGGYLREELRKRLDTENIHNKLNYENLSEYLVEQTTNLTSKYVVPELVRVFYYDGIVNEDHNDHRKQKEKFEEIEGYPNYEVRLGRLVKGSEGPRQKGVDVLLAIDMLEKAFMNHYDVALLLSGDQDYLDLVKAVKNMSGKRVYGAFFPESTSNQLERCFDNQFQLTEEFLEKITTET